jgi:hypothetical protein
MIRVLFIHQNLPGRLRRPMRYLRTRPGHAAVAIGEETTARREPAGTSVNLGDRPRIRIGNAVPMQSQPGSTCAACDLEPCRGAHVVMRGLPARRGLLTPLPHAARVDEVAA